jgi:hypothetical protein
MARIRAFENAAEEASKGGVAAFGASMAQARIRGRSTSRPGRRRLPQAFV